MRAELLQRALERRDRQVAALRRVGQALFRRSESDVMLEQVLEVALEVLPARLGALLLYDAERDELVFLCVAGPNHQTLTGHRMPASQGIAGQVLRTGTIEVTPNIRQFDGPIALLDEGNADGAGEGRKDIADGEVLITLPLKRASDQAVGILQLLRPNDEVELQQGDLEFLQVLSAAVAVALETARLAKRARQSEVVSIIGDISHDIKNMLTPIQSGLWTLEPMLDELFEDLEVLREQSHGRAAQQNIARIALPVRDLYAFICQGAQNACDQVTARTREIADAVKGELAAPFIEECDLNEIVSTVAHPLHMVADHSNVHLQLDLDPELPRAECDRKQFYNAIYNLVNNAIPETPSGGSVTVRTRRPDEAHPSQLLIEVQDTGRGMPAHVRARLFTNDAISTKSGGTGLGTRIVGGVVNRHNGTITVQSEPGQGSTFSIRLPLRYQPQIAESLVANGPMPTRRHNLPASLTSFVGRERERHLGRAALSRPATRLLSLVGPAGAGKTRLAVQIAGEMLDDFADGVWFVSLAPLEAIEGPSRVTAAIAATLGVPEEPGHALVDTLCAWLRPKHLLLVLDNFEQIMAAAPLVNDLLTTCAGLRVMVTSRSALHLSGERELSVSPLDVPSLLGMAARPSPEQLEELNRCAVVELFVERAADVKPEFVLTPENARDVVEICVRLDGLPLAIEIAAAHMKTFSCAALRERLENHLPLPQQGAQYGPLRHQTLRAALDWSYNLLGVAEQKLLRRLMVFEGGCSPYAAQFVASEAGDDVLAQLSTLADKNLLQRLDLPDGGAWFSALQTIREYGLDKLAESGEAEVLRRRHAEYYLMLTEAAHAQNVRAPDAAAPPPGVPLSSASPLVWRDWREREGINARAALRWLINNEKQAAKTDSDEALQYGALRLALTLKNVWRGEMWSERREALERALEVSPDAPDAMCLLSMLYLGDLAALQADYAQSAEWGRQSLTLSRAINSVWGIGRALGILGRVAMEEGDFQRAHELYIESLTLHRAHNNQGSIDWALYFLGVITKRAGDPVQSRDWFEQALAAFRQSDDPEGVAFALYELGMNLYDSADPNPTRRMLEESLSAFRERGHKAGIAFVLAFLGKVALNEGNLIIARKQLQECLSLSRQLGHRSQLAEVLHTLGEVALREGNIAEARTLWCEALTLYQFLKQLPLACFLLHDFARLGAAQGQTERAARLLGAAQAFTKTLSTSKGQGAAQTLEPAPELLEARNALGDTAFAVACEQGRLLTFESALKEALQI